MEPNRSLTGTLPSAVTTQDQPQALKKAVRDFAQFFEETVDRLYPYLLLSTGSAELASDVTAGVYLDAAKRSRRLFFRPELTITTLLSIAEENISAVRSKGQGSTVEFSALEAIAKSSTLFASLEESQREAKRRELAVALTTMIAQGARDRQILLLQDVLGWSAREVAFLLRVSEEHLLGEIEKARARFTDQCRAAGVDALILRTLGATPTIPSDSRQQLRTAVIEQYAHLRTTQVHLLVVLGLGAVVANALVSTVVAFAVVTDPLATLKEQTRPQLAAIDAGLLERTLSQLEQRMALVELRAQTDTIYAKQQLKDSFVAYGVLAVQEELREQREGSLALAPAQDAPLLTRFWIALEQAIDAIARALL